MEYTNQKWYVLDDNTRFGGMDIFGAETPFNTVEEAVKQAESQWNHLTYREKKRRDISVVKASALEDGSLDLEQGYDPVVTFPTGGENE